MRIYLVSSSGCAQKLPNRAKAMACIRIEQVLMDVEFPEPESLSTPYNYQC